MYVLVYTAVASMLASKTHSFESDTIKSQRVGFFSISFGGFQSQKFSIIIITIILRKPKQSEIFQTCQNLVHSLGKSIHKQVLHALHLTMYIVGLSI